MACNGEVMAHLHLQDVYHGYGNLRVLDNIDLSVRPGEFVSVVGPSGCGKSTMLRLILGEEQPIRGIVRLEGEPIIRPTPRVGVVYQNSSLFPNLTVLDNVLSGRRLSRLPWEWYQHKKVWQREATAFLGNAHLADHAHKYPHQLSGGQKQRAAVMQALFDCPKVVCMDESFSGLDAQTREAMQLFLLEQWEKLKTTVFFVTHDLEEALFMGTRLIAMSQFYTDDRGDGPNVNRGAKIVWDQQLRGIGQAVSPEIKRTAAFGSLAEDIRRNYFKPTHRQRVERFRLTHPDSWQTLQPEESKALAS